MIRRARKSTVVAMALLAALAVGACGSSHSKVSTGTYAGESGANAPYLDVGPLTYEVQLSRQLNPFDVEDSAYLQGLTLTQPRLLPGEGRRGVAAGARFDEQHADRHARVQGRREGGEPGVGVAAFGFAALAPFAAFAAARFGRRAGCALGLQFGGPGLARDRHPGDRR